MSERPVISMQVISGVLHFQIAWCPMYFYNLTKFKFSILYPMHRFYGLGLTDFI